MNHVWAILVAGGAGNRFGAKLPKQFLDLGGRPLIEYSLDLFSSLEDISGIVLVLPEEHIAPWKQRLEPRQPHKFRFGAGGLTRQKSVQNGMALVDSGADWVVVHDVARPMVKADLIKRALQGAKETGCAVVALPVADTLKKADEAQFVEKTVSREQLYSVQTPQVFSRKLLEEALRWAESRGLDATDEAGVVERMGHRVKLVDGSVFNFKVTRPQDLEMAEALMRYQKEPKGVVDLRIGEGYDVHAFAEGRKLILGGVEIPHDKGLLGHSDADALLHAIGDAMLGAVAEGDLGKHFPDSDPQYKGVSSEFLLGKISELLDKKGFGVANVDATIVCQRPKLAPHVPRMRENIAKALKIDVERVSVKATTEEGLGFTGTQQGLAARAIVLVKK